MDITLKQGYRDITGKSSKDGQEYKRVYIVSNTDTTVDMEYRIINHNDIPKYGDSYPADSNLKVSNVSISMQEDVNFIEWEAEVTYKLPDDDDDSSETIDGFTRDLQVFGRTQQYEVPLEAGYDGSNNQYKSNGDIIIPVVSTSNEALLVSKYDANIVIDITQNVSAFEFDWMRQFKNSTNSKSSNIVGINIGVNQARILDLSGASQVDATGAVYYAVTMSIEITDTDFNVRPSNKGFMMADPETASEFAVKFITKADIGTGEEGTELGDEPINEPARLTLANVPIPNGDKGAHYLEFKAYPSLDWGVLDIPSQPPERVRL